WVISHFNTTVCEIHNPILRDSTSSISRNFSPTVVGEARIRHLNQEEYVTRLRVFVPVVVWVKPTNSDIWLRFAPIVDDDWRLYANSEICPKCTNNDSSQVTLCPSVWRILWSCRDDLTI